MCCSVIIFNLIMLGFQVTDRVTGGSHTPALMELPKRLYLADFNNNQFCAFPSVHSVPTEEVKVLVLSSPISIRTDHWIDFDPTRPLIPVWMKRIRIGPYVTVLFCASQQ